MALTGVHLPELSVPWSDAALTWSSSDLKQLAADPDAIWWLFQSSLMMIRTVTRISAIGI